VLCCILYLIAQGSARDQDECAGLLGDSERFALNSLRKLGLPEPDFRSDLQAQLGESLLRLMPGILSTLERNGTLRRIVRLLLRAKQSGAAGQGVGTHALHLLCNKVGFSFADESYLFGALRSVSAARAA